MKSLWLVLVLSTKRHAATVALFSLFALLMFGADKPAAKDTIWLDTDLQLGLSKQIVMSRLAEYYKLVKIGELGDSWMVQSKNAPLVTYGQVTFENGKLVLAVRNWTNGDEDTVAFAQALHGALDQFGKENRQLCSVQTNTSRTPTVEYRTVNLDCGAKRLAIEITDTLSGEFKGKTASIQEMLASNAK